MTDLASLLGGTQSVDPSTYRRRLAAMLIDKSQGGPVASWTQGAGRLANALVGGLMLRREDEEQREKDARFAAALGNLPGLGGAEPAPMQARMPAPVAMQPQSRPPVPSTSRVMGDEEAMRLGLYDRGPDGKAVVQTDGLAGDRPSSFNQRFAAATPGQVQEPAAQPQPQPVQMAQAQPRGDPMRQQLQIPPEVASRIRQYMGSGDKRIQAIGMQLYQQYAKPTEQKPLVQVDRGTRVDMVDPMTGQVVQSFPKDIAGEAGQKKRGEITTEKELAKAFARPGEVQAANIVTTDIDRGLKIIKDTPTRSTGFLGEMLKSIPESEANKLAGLLTTIKANAGFSQLQQMRQASPTGGALGNVTEQEMKFLQSAIGDLEQSRGSEMLSYNLRRVKNIYSDIIHGQGQGPAREQLGEQRGGGQAAPKSKAEFDALPSGTLFTAPDGSVRRKP